MWKIMLKFLLLAIAFMAHIALGEEANVDSFKFVDGKCIYRNHTIEPYDAEVPRDICEMWECDPEKKTIVVTGCYIGDRYSSCHHHSQHGIRWPRCCHTYRATC
uniref:Single domain-containing protein n=1 Tax=Amblyomma cajennense TaxID=34607 RepID=A0A023FSS2_AMBCJ